MPESWALDLHVRGAAPANKLEIKLADPSGRNVWWWHRDAFEFPRDVAAAAHPQQRGRVRVGAGGRRRAARARRDRDRDRRRAGRHAARYRSRDLRFEDLSLTGPPLVRASSAAPGHEPAHALDASPATSWRSAPARAAVARARLRPRARVRRARDRLGARRARRAPSTCRAPTTARAGRRSGPRARPRASAATSTCRAVVARATCGSTCCEPAAGSGRVRDPHARRAALRVLALARRVLPRRRGGEPRGHHPRWLHREQSYWTPVGVAGGTTRGDPERGGHARARSRQLLARAVPVRRRRAGHVGGRRARGRRSRTACLPIPSSTWRLRRSRADHDGVRRRGSAAGPRRACLRTASRTKVGRAKRVRLFVALRPFQVTPPWQAFAGLGGTAPIRALAWRDGAVVVDDDSARRAAHAAERVRRRRVRAGRGAAPPRARRAAAATRGRRRVRLRVRRALLGSRARARRGARRGTRGSVRRASRARIHVDPAEARGGAPRDSLDDVDARLGAQARPRRRSPARRARTGVRGHAAHRDRTHPGQPRRPRAPARAAALHAVVDPRRRDHVGGAAAHGLRRRGARLPRWYAHVPGRRRQRAVRGRPQRARLAAGARQPRPARLHARRVLPLHRRPRLRRALWPAARRAVGYLEALRAQRLTPEFRDAREARALRHPARVGEPRGLSRAAGPRLLGRLLGAARASATRRSWRSALGDAARPTRMRALRDALHACLYESIATTIAARAPRLRPRLGRVGRLRSHRDRHRDRHDRRRASACRRPRSRGPSTSTCAASAGGARGEIDWNNYSAYEIRILGALVRLGRRADAHELLEFFLADRRPQPWNQWPEISWRDPRSPGHLGDVPHAWIGAEYVLAVLGMFAYERPGDDSARARGRHLRRVARRRRGWR